MGNSDAPNTPAGWYPDPDNSLQKKFWDGQNWVDAVSPNQAGASYWEGKVNYSETTNNDKLPLKKHSKFRFSWPLLVSVAIALLIALQSCDSGNWQMGVDGNGYKVTCRDGTISMSGGIQGACSQHGGVE